MSDSPQSPKSTPPASGRGSTATERIRNILTHNGAPLLNWLDQLAQEYEANPDDEALKEKLDSLLSGLNSRIGTELGGDAGSVRSFLSAGQRITLQKSDLKENLRFFNWVAKHPFQNLPEDARISFDVFNPGYVYEGPGGSHTLKKATIVPTKDEPSDDVYHPREHLDTGAFYKPDDPTNAILNSLFSADSSGVNLFGALEAFKGSTDLRQKVSALQSKIRNDVVKALGGGRDNIEQTPDSLVYQNGSERFALRSPQSAPLSWSSGPPAPPAVPPPPPPAPPAAPPPDDDDPDDKSGFSRNQFDDWSDWSPPQIRKPTPAEDVSVEELRRRTSLALRARLREASRTNALIERQQELASRERQEQITAETLRVRAADTERKQYDRFGEFQEDEQYAQQYMMQRVEEEGAKLVEAGLLHPTEFEMYRGASTNVGKARSLRNRIAEINRDSRYAKEQVERQNRQELALTKYKSNVIDTWMADTYKGKKNRGQWQDPKEVVVQGKKYLQMEREVQTRDGKWERQSYLVNVMPASTGVTDTNIGTLVINGMAIHSVLPNADQREGWTTTSADTQRQTWGRAFGGRGNPFKNVGMGKKKDQDDAGVARPVPLSNIGSGAYSDLEHTAVVGKGINPDKAADLERNQIVVRTAGASSALMMEGLYDLPGFQARPGGLVEMPNSKWVKRQRQAGQSSHAIYTLTGEEVPTKLNESTGQRGVPMRQLILMNMMGGLFQNAYMNKGMALTAGEERMKTIDLGDRKSLTDDEEKQLSAMVGVVSKNRDDATFTLNGQEHNLMGNYAGMRIEGYELNEGKLRIRYRRFAGMSPDDPGNLKVWADTKNMVSPSDFEALGTHWEDPDRPAIDPYTGEAARPFAQTYQMLQVMSGNEIAVMLNIVGNLPDKDREIWRQQEHENLIKSGKKSEEVTQRDVDLAVYRNNVIFDKRFTREVFSNQYVSQEWYDLATQYGMNFDSWQGEDKPGMVRVRVKAYAHDVMKTENFRVELAGNTAAISAAEQTARLQRAGPEEKEAVLSLGQEAYERALGVQLATNANASDRGGKPPEDVFDISRLSEKERISILQKMQAKAKDDYGDNPTEAQQQSALYSVIRDTVGDKTVKLSTEGGKDYYFMSPETAEYFSASDAKGKTSGFARKYSRMMFNAITSGGQLEDAELSKLADAQKKVAETPSMRRAALGQGKSSLRKTKYMLHDERLHPNEVAINDNEAAFMFLRLQRAQGNKDITFSEAKKLMMEAAERGEAVLGGTRNPQFPGDATYNFKYVTEAELRQRGSTISIPRGTVVTSGINAQAQGADFDADIMQVFLAGGKGGFAKPSSNDELTKAAVDNPAGEFQSVMKDITGKKRGRTLTEYQKYAGSILGNKTKAQIASESADVAEAKKRMGIFFNMAVAMQAAGITDPEAFQAQKAIYQKVIDLAVARGGPEDLLMSLRNTSLVTGQRRNPDAKEGADDEFVAIPGVLKGTSGERGQGLSQLTAFSLNLTRAVLEMHDISPDRSAAFIAPSSLGDEGKALLSSKIEELRKKDGGFTGDDVTALHDFIMEAHNAASGEENQASFILDTDSPVVADISQAAMIAERRGKRFRRTKGGALIPSQDAIMQRMLKSHAKTRAHLDLTSNRSYDEGDAVQGRYTGTSHEGFMDAIALIGSQEGANPAYQRLYKDLEQSGITQITEEQWLDNRKKMEEDLKARKQLLIEAKRAKQAQGAQQRTVAQPVAQQPAIPSLKRTEIDTRMHPSSAGTTAEGILAKGLVRSLGQNPDDFVDWTKVSRKSRPLPSEFRPTGLFSTDPSGADRAADIGKAAHQFIQDNWKSLTADFPQGGPQSLSEVFGDIRSEDDVIRGWGSFAAGSGTAGQGAAKWSAGGVDFIGRPDIITQGDRRALIDIKPGASVENGSLKAYLAQTAAYAIGALQAGEDISEYGILAYGKTTDATSGDVTFDASRLSYIDRPIFRSREEFESAIPERQNWAIWRENANSEWQVPANLRAEFENMRKAQIALRVQEAIARYKESGNTEGLAELIKTLRSSQNNEPVSTAEDGSAGGKKKLIVGERGPEYAEVDENGDLRVVPLTGVMKDRAESGRLQSKSPTSPAQSLNRMSIDTAEDGTDGDALLRELQELMKAQDIPGLDDALKHVNPALDPAIRNAYGVNVQGASVAATQPDAAQNATPAAATQQPQPQPIIVNPLVQTSDKPVRVEIVQKPQGLQGKAVMSAVKGASHAKADIAAIEAFRAARKSGSQLTPEQAIAADRAFARIETTTKTVDRAIFHHGINYNPQTGKVTQGGVDPSKQMPTAASEFALSQMLGIQPDGQGGWKQSDHNQEIASGTRDILQYAGEFAADPKEWDILRAEAAALAEQGKLDLKENRRSSKPTAHEREMAKYDRDANRAAERAGRRSKPSQRLTPYERNVSDTVNLAIGDIEAEQDRILSAAEYEQKEVRSGYAQRKRDQEKAEREQAAATRLADRAQRDEARERAGIDRTRSRSMQNPEEFTATLQAYTHGIDELTSKFDKSSKSVKELTNTHEKHIVALSETQSRLKATIATANEIMGDDKASSAQKAWAQDIIGRYGSEVGRGAIRPDATTVLDKKLEGSDISVSSFARARPSRLDLDDELNAREKWSLWLRRGREGRIARQEAMDAGEFGKEGSIQRAGWQVGGAVVGGFDKFVHSYWQFEQLGRMFVSPMSRRAEEYQRQGGAISSIFDQGFNVSSDSAMESDLYRSTTGMRNMQSRADFGIGQAYSQAWSPWMQAISNNLGNNTLAQGASIFGPALAAGVAATSVGLPPMFAAAVAGGVGIAGVGGMISSNQNDVWRRAQFRTLQDRIGSQQGTFADLFGGALPAIYQKLSDPNAYAATEANAQRIQTALEGYRMGNAAFASEALSSMTMKGAMSTQELQEYYQKNGKLPNGYRFSANFGLAGVISQDSVIKDTYVEQIPESQRQIRLLPGRSGDQAMDWQMSSQFLGAAFQDFVTSRIGEYDAGKFKGTLATGATSNAQILSGMSQEQLAQLYTMSTTVFSPQQLGGLSPAMYNKTTGNEWEPYATGYGDLESRREKFMADVGRRQEAGIDVAGMAQLDAAMRGYSFAPGTKEYSRAWRNALEFGQIGGVQLTEAQQKLISPQLEQIAQIQSGLTSSGVSGGFDLGKFVEILEDGKLLEASQFLQTQGVRANVGAIGGEDAGNRWAGLLGGYSGDVGRAREYQIFAGRAGASAGYGQFMRSQGFSGGQVSSFNIFSGAGLDFNDQQIQQAASYMYSTGLAYGTGGDKGLVGAGINQIGFVQAAGLDAEGLAQAQARAAGVDVGMPELINSFRKGVLDEISQWRKNWESDWEATHPDDGSQTADERAAQRDADYSMALATKRYEIGRQIAANQAGEQANLLGIGGAFYSGMFEVGGGVKDQYLENAMRIMQTDAGIAGSGYGILSGSSQAAQKALIAGDVTQSDVLMRNQGVIAQYRQGVASRGGDWRGVTRITDGWNVKYGGKDQQTFDLAMAAAQGDPIAMSQLVSASGINESNAAMYQVQTGRYGGTKGMFAGYDENLMDPRLAAVRQRFIDYGQRRGGVTGVYAKEAGLDVTELDYMSATAEMNNIQMMDFFRQQRMGDAELSNRRNRMIGEGPMFSGLRSDDTVGDITAEAGIDTFVDKLTGKTLKALVDSIEGGEWGLEDAMTNLSRERQDWDVSMSEKRLALSETRFGQEEAQWQERFAFNTNRTMVQLGWQDTDLQRRATQNRAQSQWQGQDLLFSRNQSEMQFGWQMEDFDRNIRYARGMERRDLMRQQERAVISHSMNMTQSDREMERHEQRKKWMEEEIQIDRNRYEQNKRWTIEEIEMTKRHHDQDMGNQRQEMEYSRQSFEMQRRWLQQERQLEDQNRALRRAIALAEQKNAENLKSITDRTSTSMQALANWVNDITGSNSEVSQMVDYWAKIGLTVPKVNDALETFNSKMLKIGNTASGNRGGGGGNQYKWDGGYVQELFTGGMAFDFSGGGHTGSGGKYEPAGVVHGGEYVVPQNGALVVRGDNQEVVRVLQRILDAIMRTGGNGSMNVTIHSTDTKSALDATMSMKDKAFAQRIS